MTADGIKRKLAAILSADVKDYSRLMRDDEPLTVRTLNAYRDVISKLIRQHHGRVVDSPGDNLLAEFASVVDGVQAAVAIQKELRAMNARLSSSRKMEFRIGINLGDIIEEQGPADRGAHAAAVGRARRQRGAFGKQQFYRWEKQ